MLLYRLLLCFTLYFQVQSPGGLYSEGRFNGRFFALEFGGLYLEGLIHGVAYFRNFKVITTFLRPKQPNRYYVSLMQTGFCPPASITLGDSLSPDKPETRAKYETVFLCLNN